MLVSVWASGGNALVGEANVASQGGLSGPASRLCNVKAVINMIFIPPGDGLRPRCTGLLPVGVYRCQHPMSASHGPCGRCHYASVSRTLLEVATPEPRALSRAATMSPSVSVSSPPCFLDLGQYSFPGQFPPTRTSKHSKDDLKMSYKAAIRNEMKTAVSDGQGTRKSLCSKEYLTTWIASCAVRRGPEPRREMSLSALRGP